jgi:tetratricopeptide (TPR) repeat protein
LEGENAFKVGDYKAAIHAWRHAIVDEPESATLLLRLAQALFANGQYAEAAGAAQQALVLLPQESWVSEAATSKKLFANRQHYEDQLKGLEKAVKENPNEPALRFELGFQYVLSGRQEEGVRELDKLLELAPQDQISRTLRDKIAAELASPRRAPDGQVN